MIFSGDWTVMKQNGLIFGIISMLDIGYYVSNEMLL